jgi:hypothetical protein
MAEMTLCCLFRTWSPMAIGHSQSSIAAGVSSGTMSNRLLLSAFAGITDAAFRRAQYPLFPGTGCNWKCPLQEASIDRREWLRYCVTTLDNREMLVYRWQSVVTQVDSDMENTLGVRMQFLAPFNMHANEGPKWNGFELTQRLDHLPGVRRGQPLIVSIELMKDGKPHPQPWYRHPHQGAWDNSGELHSFGIKAEWVDEATNQWYTYPCQHGTMTSLYSKTPSESTVTLPWRKATMILQFIHNRRYRNPPHFLQDTFRPNIKEVVYDHLAQTVTLQQVPETILDPPRHVSFLL